MLGGFETIIYIRMKCGQFQCAHCGKWEFATVRGQYQCAACEAEEREPAPKVEPKPALPKD